MVCFTGEKSIWQYYSAMDQLLSGKLISDTSSSTKKCKDEEEMEAEVGGKWYYSLQCAVQSA